LQLRDLVSTILILVVLVVGAYPFPPGMQPLYFFEISALHNQQCCNLSETAESSVSRPIFVCKQVDTKCPRAELPPAEILTLDNVFPKSSATPTFPQPRPNATSAQTRPTRAQTTTEPHHRRDRHSTGHSSGSPSDHGTAKGDPMPTTSSRATIKQVAWRLLPLSSSSTSSASSTE